MTSTLAYVHSEHTQVYVWVVGHFVVDHMLTSHKILTSLEGELVLPVIGNVVSAER